LDIDELLPESDDGISVDRGLKTDVNGDNVDNTDTIGIEVDIDNSLKPDKEGEPFIQLYLEGI